MTGRKNSFAGASSHAAGNVLEYLEHAAAHYPGRDAWLSLAEHVTWGEVLDSAMHIGSGLLCAHLASGACGSTSSQPIAVLMGKEPHTAVAMMGILYSGHSYACLDLALPMARLSEVLLQLQPAACLYSEETAELAENLRGTLQQRCPAAWLSLQGLQAAPICAGQLAAARSSHTPEDTLSITFTSSSTGMPKGVETSHSAVMRYIDGLGKILRADERSIFGNQSPLCFDASLKELYVPMKYGGSAFFLPPSLFSQPVELMELMDAQHINTICWVSSALTLAAALDVFGEATPACLRTVAFGSEILPPSALRYWQDSLPQARFLNLYGPTEATGMSCYFEVPANFVGSPAFTELYEGRIPIGKPFPGVRIRLQPEPEGEILIHSDRLAKGYCHAPELTRKAFLAGTKIPGEEGVAGQPRVYRTGDLGKRAADGNLLFLGRRDLQVKRMGYQIHLGEIERLAQSCPGVGLCCCVQHKDGQIYLYLTPAAPPAQLAPAAPVATSPDPSAAPVATSPVPSAALVATSPDPSAAPVAASPDPSAALVGSVRECLGQRLPRHSQPNQIQVCPSLPMLPGGKINRRAVAAGM